MGNNNTAFKCDYVYTFTDKKKSTYRTQLEARQYRRLPYNMVSTDRAALRKIQKRRRPVLVLGDTMKLIVHNFILNNVNRNAVHGAPGDDSWNTALLQEIKLEESGVTPNDIGRWVRHHPWIRLRHCQFMAQKEGEEEAAESTIKQEKNVKASFNVQHIYKTGSKGMDYKVNIHPRQFPRLPNNFIGPKKTLGVKKEKSPGCSTKLRPRNEKKNIKKITRPVIGDSIKLVLHNFILENVEHGEPHGVPGDDRWSREALTRIRREDERVTAQDVARWVDSHCWIILTHNNFTEQKQRR